MITRKKFLDADAKREADALRRRSGEYEALAERRSMHEAAKQYLSDPEVMKFTGRQALLGLQKIEQERSLDTSAAEISAWRFAQLLDGALDILLHLRYSDDAHAGDGGYKGLEDELLRHTVSSVEQLGEPRLEDYGGFLNIRISNPDERYLAGAISRLMENPEALESANVRLNFFYSAAAPHAASAHPKADESERPYAPQAMQPVRYSSNREMIADYADVHGGISAAKASEITGLKLVEARDLLASMARSGEMQRNGSVYVPNGAESAEGAEQEEGVAQGKRRHGWGKASEAVLEYLAGKGGPARMTEIAKACETPYSTVYRLEKQGRIKKAGYGLYSSL